MEVNESPWRFMEVHGDSMEIHEDPWRFDGGPWRSMENVGGDSTEINGDLMDLHWFASVSMNPHGSSWKFMGDYGDSMEIDGGPWRPHGD